MKRKLFLTGLLMGFLGAHVSVSDIRYFVQKLGQMALGPTQENTTAIVQNQPVLVLQIV